MERARLLLEIWGQEGVGPKLEFLPPGPGEGGQLPSDEDTLLEDHHRREYLPGHCSRLSRDMQRRLEKGFRI